jgi:hypothetical protein
MPTDHLYNLVTAAGAGAAVLGLVGGVGITALYSRKANASVTADSYSMDGLTFLAIRPSVTASGPFRLKFADVEGATVEVIPSLRTVNGEGTEEGTPVTSPPRTAFPNDVERRPQFVNPGETLTSSLLVVVDPKAPRLIGWYVCFNVASKGVIRHGLHWADRAFVPVGPGTLFPTSGGTNHGKYEAEQSIADEHGPAAEHPGQEGG